VLEELESVRNIARQAHDPLAGPLRIGGRAHRPGDLSRRGPCE
jgi:hypothetical protein